MCAAEEARISTSLLGASNDNVSVDGRRTREGYTLSEKMVRSRASANHAVGEAVAG